MGPGGPQKQLFGVVLGHSLADREAATSYLQRPYASPLLFLLLQEKASGSLVSTPLSGSKQALEQQVDLLLESLADIHIAVCGAHQFLR